MASVGAGGQVVFFGGTAAGVEVAIDAQWLHYSEIGLHGVYHHRPASFRRALELLAAETLPFDRLISDILPLEELPQALQRMADRRAIKVALTAWR